MKANLKKFGKAVIFIAIIALAVFCLYNIVSAFRYGKLNVSVTTATKYYAEDNIEAIVTVKNLDTGDLVGSKVKVELLSSDNKKIKGVKETYKIEEGDTANVSIALPEDIDTGNYTLKITSTSGIKKAVEEVNISIVSGAQTKTVISFDKGIYKPGDDVGFRAMIISEKTSKPVEQEVTIEIYDGNDNRVYKDTTETSEYGIVSGTFTLADEVNSGTYKLFVTTSSETTSESFIVNPYVTPTYEVTLNTEQDSYVLGDTVTATLNAEYFFGEPVTNATITGTINDEEIAGLTDENGNYTITYIPEKTGTLEISVQVVDTSNYYVEASKSVSVGTDIFEIEVLPVNGDLIKGLDNEVYVLTKTINGTAVKTHCTVTIGTIKKQVVTDENGVGSFTLTSSDLSSISSSSNFSVEAEDMEGNVVTSKIEVDIVNNTGIVVTTDSVKYAEGDDITISLNSTTDLNNEKIYIYKGEELLKMVSTDLNEITVNLDEISGLVDIYATNDDTITQYSNFISLTGISDTSKYYKRTIFIKPEKELNIEVTTDSDEYEPGDTLNIEFKTTDENNSSTDAALLVSILDEAVLSLAENDLSIDNLKLALEDIELTDGVTAADLYADVLDDSSETLLMSVLLKQSSSEPNVKNVSGGATDISEYIMRAIISGLVIFLILTFISYAKSEKAQNVVKAIVNCLVIWILLFMAISEIVDGGLYYTIRDSSVLAEAFISIVITFAVYGLFLYKKRDEILNAITELLVFPGILVAIAALAYCIKEKFILLILLAPALFYAILGVRSRRKQFGKFGQIVTAIFGSLCRVELMYIATMLVTIFLDIEGSFTAWVVVLIIIYWFCKTIFNRNEKRKDNNRSRNITINITGFEGLGGIFAIILVILIICVVRTMFSNFSSGLDSTTYIDDDFSYKSGDISLDAFNSSDTTSSVQNKSSISDTIEDITSIFSNDGYNDLAIETEEQITYNEEVGDEESSVSTDTETEVNVRNVFLESLAFIPELVTTNGEADTDIVLSDNITTWNIQVVGNTKEGNIGYASTEIKVFKEFFIDFSLPTNSVVTDQTSIPVTVYNYKDTDMEVSLNVVENDWSNIGEYATTVTVSANSTQLVYVPIEILEAGSNTLRIEAKADGVQDIVERTMTVTPNGLEKTNVISSGTIENAYSQDYFSTEDAIEGTREVTVKIYSSLMSQAVEGIESILKMPSGCFEQVSSSLYPDILVLNYLNETGTADEELKAKALEYISTGYQKLLTYEVQGETGGYSLYGRSPAETVLTAFGLMEINDLSEVYDVEDKVIDNMVEFLFSKQKLNGSFDYDDTFIDDYIATDDLSLNAYITWALSEVCPDDSRLESSVSYLENNIDKIEDNYALALMANVFVNTGSSYADTAIDRIIDKIKTEGDTAYLSSEIQDYWGSYGRTQNIQTTALASLALSKDGSNTKTNTALINYLISAKDTRGTWSTTQATVLSLKAINEYNSKEDLKEQTISITLNGETQDIEIGEDELDIYEVTFENVADEGSIEIGMKKGKLYYEIIESCYIANEDIEENDEVIVEQSFNSTEFKVNDEVIQTITMTNNSNSLMANGMVTINVPQGCSVDEDSLLELVYNGVVQKYEYSYGVINLYLRNWKAGESITASITYRAGYPETITGGAIRVYDYYNPTTEGFAKPITIQVSE